MTSKQLTVQNASITTAAIEVKTLMIGARQVTQGIFRQLIEEPLIAEDGTLNGVPWGHVTWHPDKCEVAAAHWHIVWQHGEELRRSRVYTKPNFESDHDLREYTADEADRFLTAWVREATHNRANRAVITGPKHEDDLYGRSLRQPVNDETNVPTWAHMSNTARDAAIKDRRASTAYERAARPLEWHELNWATYDDWSEAHPAAAAVLKPAVEAGVKVSLDRAHDGDLHVRITCPGLNTRDLGTAVRAEQAAVLELLIEKRGDSMAQWAKALEHRDNAFGELDAEVDSWGLTWPEIQAEYDAAIRAEAARRQRHRDIRATLAQLPQLFIGG